MSYAQGQQTYNVFPTIAVPGQLYDLEYNVIRSFCAASASAKVQNPLLLHTHLDSEASQLE